MNLNPTTLYSRAHVGSIVNKFQDVDGDKKLRSSSNRTLYTRPLSKTSILKFLGNQSARKEVKDKQKAAVAELCESFDRTYGAGTAERIGLAGRTSVTVGEVREFVADLHTDDTAYVLAQVRPNAQAGLASIGQAWDSIAEKSLTKTIDQVMKATPGKARPKRKIIIAAVNKLYSAGAAPTEDDVLRTAKCLESEKFDQDKLLKHTTDAISRECQEKDPETGKLVPIRAAGMDMFLRSNSDETAIVYHQMRLGFDACAPEVQANFTDLLKNSTSPDDLEDKISRTFTSDAASKMPDSLCEHFAAAHSAITVNAKNMSPADRAGLIEKLECQFALRVLAPIYFRQGMTETNADRKKALMKLNASFQKAVNQGNSAYAEFMEKVVERGYQLLAVRNA
jgi:hypothetical protein